MIQLIQLKKKDATVAQEKRVLQGEDPFAVAEKEDAPDGGDDDADDE